MPNFKDNKAMVKWLIAEYKPEYRQILSAYYLSGEARGIIEKRHSHLSRKEIEALFQDFESRLQRQEAL